MSLTLFMKTFLWAYKNERKNGHLFLTDDIIEFDKDPHHNYIIRTHPILSTERNESAYNEIKKSKLILEKLGHSIQHFAYPFEVEVGYREYEIKKIEI